MSIENSNLNRAVVDAQNNVQDIRMHCAVPGHKCTLEQSLCQCGNQFTACTEYEGRCLSCMDSVLMECLQNVAAAIAEDI